ncbi:glycine--tRNA ligase subunit beta [Brevundimonas sp. AJA228-03]|uniref:glycine--tRNA ligase subunit beta n=1 Tax=Brevundimonas sp. AJA228-03 TaxID=2752515 RepID=UPI001ADF576E|nr:glycine--tRNA ligase subunit beta [Brevundimonas sp. AJA228-03]QTN20602.1 glycine--tRNA ligase subunit beta [Brevundimonas sp. AJA228-03]
MPQLLLELFSEEIPARMQAGAARDLERMASERLKAAGLSWDTLTTYAGPRRLTLVIEGLPAATPDRSEELKGPRANAPEQALEGFLRKTGLTRDQLTERDGVLFAVIEEAGRPTTAVIAETVDQIVRAFPWPKSMRWGSGTLRWVRPLKRIVALFDGAVVPFEIDGIRSGDVTEGHRFMGSGQPFAVKDFADYRAKLEQHFVLLDAADRKLKILEAARAACQTQGLELVDDDGLLEEVAGLAEWPTPILGDMDPQFLDLPPEVVRLSMKVHQKYFAVRRPPSSPEPSPPSGGSTREAGEGGLAPNFIVVANVEASDGGVALAAGNSRVLSARLNDARFFWDEDRKTGFDVWNEKLKGVTFHARLGTMAERVDRIAALAREIAPLVGADPDQAETAARLAKADLASGMVGEFPELQGIMGGYYARALPPSNPALQASVPPEGGHLPSQSPPSGGSTREAGEGGCSNAIADAIRDHYKPQGPADSVPTAPLTVAVALADKLDTLVGFFAIDEKPTGSKDPFALRRAALGVIRLIEAGNVPIELRGNDLLFNHIKRMPNMADAVYLQVAPILDAITFDFLSDRLEVFLRDRGTNIETVRAAFGRTLSGFKPVDLIASVEALDAFLATDDGANLLAGYKRASNILKAEEKKGPVPTGEPGVPDGIPAQEATLIFAVKGAAYEVAKALEAEDFAEAMRQLALLRAPVDAFFTDVMVNSDVPEERENRLKLLGQVRDVMGRVADFGQVSG